MNPTPSPTPFEFFPPPPQQPPRLKRRPTPTSPMKPTSSFARRRRSLIISAPPQSSTSLNAILSQGPDDELMSQAAAEVVDDDIAQAMTLLSLHPPSSGSGAAWPDPEELLKESLRQSLGALRTLRESKKIVECRRMSGGDAPGEPGVWEVEGMIEKVVGNLRGAREVLGWAEQQLETEKTALREQLLKG